MKHKDETQKAQKTRHGDYAAGISGNTGNGERHVRAALPFRVSGVPLNPIRRGFCGYRKKVNAPDVKLKKSMAVFVRVYFHCVLCVYLTAKSTTAMTITSSLYAKQRGGVNRGDRKGGDGHFDVIVTDINWEPRGRTGLIHDLCGDVPIVFGVSL